jgi:hypothetical protein
MLTISRAISFRHFFFRWYVNFCTLLQYHYVLGFLYIIFLCTCLPGGKTSLLVSCSRTLFWNFLSLSDHFCHIQRMCRGLLLHLIALCDTYSVVLIWKRDRPVAETTTWQYATFTRDRQLYLPWDSNPKFQQASDLGPGSAYFYTYLLHGVESFLRS